MQSVFGVALVVLLMYSQPAGARGGYSDSVVNQAESTGAPREQASTQEATPPQVWTLEACIERAQREGLEVKASELQAQSAKADLLKAKWAYAPTISANAGVGLNFGRPVEMAGVSVSNDNLSTNFSIGASLTLFDGLARLRTLQMQRLQAEYQEVYTELVRENMALTVAQAFFQIVYQRELYRVREQGLEASRARLCEYELQVRFGQRTEGELRDLEAQLAQDELQMEEAENGLLTARAALQLLLRLDVDTPFDVQAPEIDSVSLPSLPSEGLLAIYERALGEYPSMVAARISTEQARRGVQASYAGYMPRLQLSANYGSGTRHYLESQAGRVEAGFPTQFRDNATQSVALTLSIPIFDGFTAQTQVAQAKIGLSQAQLGEQRAEIKLFDDVQGAYIAALAAQRQHESARRALVAQQQAFAWAESRMRLGAISNFEYMAAKTRLGQSETSYLQSKYSYLLKVKVLRHYMGEPFSL